MGNAAKNPEDKFEILLESSPIGIYYSDFYGKFLYGNAKAEEIIGYPKKELIGKNFLKLKLLPLADLKKAAKLLALNRMGRDTDPDEFTLIRRDGTRRRVEIATRIITIEGKKVIMGLAQDITHRKRVENELTELNRHNELKAEIWKMAADQSSADENEFIQKLLNVIGPAMKVSRASYLRFDTSKKAFVSELQWAKKGIGSSLGEDISWKKAELFFGRNCVELPRDIDRLIETPIINRAVKAYAAAKLKKNGIKNYLVVTYGNLDAPEALFTFSECEKERSWTEFEKRILSELVNIVSIKSEQIRAEARINASLREKVVMLQEIHHRVKNNMQVISSLLNIQSDSIPDEKTRQIFRECQGRIRSMALVHERLYQSENLANIDFAPYIERLVADLFRMYRVNPSSVQLKTDLGHIHLDINRAIPCGLIVNELVSNSLKHAFPGRREGTIHIGMQTKGRGRIQMKVSDTGIGLPEQISFPSTESLGLRLVNDLVRQIDGSVRLESGPGTSFLISF